MTPVFCCGASCNVTGISTSTGRVGEHYHRQGVAPTVDTSNFPYGAEASWSWAAATSSQTDYISHQMAGQTTVSGRFYMYVTAYPTTVMTIARFNNANGAAFLKMNSAGLMLIRMGASAADVSSVYTPPLNTWVRVDWKADASGGTATTTATFDAASAVTDTHVQTSANFSSFAVGPNITNNVGTTTGIKFASLLVAALADYPIGDGGVRGFRVGATSGTHSQTAGDFQNDAGTNITNGDGSGAKINETVPDTTSFIKEVALGTAGGYVEYIYATTTEGFTPRAVEQVVSVKNVSLTTANNEKSQLYDGTSAVDAYALTSIGATTLVDRSTQWASPPSGGAWTGALFALLRLRWGFSTDIVPVPAISHTILEAEFPLGRLYPIGQDNSYRAPASINQAVNRATSY